MKIGIAIDPWKLEIFERHLKANGYKWENPGPFAGIILLKVTTDNAEALAEVIKTAQTEAALSKAAK